MTRVAMRMVLLVIGALSLALALAACGSAAPPTAAPAPAQKAAEAPTVAKAAEAPKATEAPKAAEAPKTTEAPAAKAAPASGGTTPGVTDSEIVIGSWGPQDGPAGAYGVIDRTIAAYFKKVNDDGGINGRKIRFIYENDSYQPAKTTAAVKKLVEEDKVFALVGGLGTAQNMAVMDYLVQNKVPHLAPSTGSGLMSKPVKPNVFQVQLNYTNEATLLTQYALDKLSAKKIAVFYQNDAFGKEGLDAVNAELKKRNMGEASGVSYEPSDTNFSSQALKLQSTGADTVVIYAVPKPGASIIAEMDKIGFKPNLLASSVINDPALFQLAGPGIEGLLLLAWLPAFDDTSNPKIVEYQNFMKKYAPNEQIGGFSETGYTYATIATDALKQAGKDLTREGFLKVLESLQDYKGSLVPSLSYNSTDHSGAKAAYFQQAKGGKFVTISDFMTPK